MLISNHTCLVLDSDQAIELCYRVTCTLTFRSAHCSIGRDSGQSSSVMYSSYCTVLHSTSLAATAQSPGVRGALCRDVAAPPAGVAEDRGGAVARKVAGQAAIEARH